MFYKLWLIILFWLNIFVLTRVFELIGLFDRGLGCSVRHSNISTLDMKTLKLILSYRGISYTRAVDKIEMYSLLSGSGDLSEGEFMMTVKNSLTQEKVLEHHRQFDSIGQLLFEHLQTEIWLVQIQYDVSHVDDGDDVVDWTGSTEWMRFLKTVQALGLRTASVNCSDSICLQEGWRHGQPVLILPHGKTRIYYQSYYKRDDETSRDPDALLDWLTVRLLKRLHRIESYSEFEREWLSFNKRATWQPQRVNLVIFVNDTVPPPLFLVSLSVEFDGRVRIGQISMSALRTDVLLTLAGTNPMLVVTPETMRPYGSKSGECLTLVSLRMFLASLAPSTADIESVVLSLSLMTCYIELFVVTGGPVRRLFRFFSLFTKLIMSIVVWVMFAELVLPGFDLEVLYDGLSAILRVISLTSFADQFRSDWLCYSTTNYGTFLVSFTAYSASVGWWHRRVRLQRQKFFADVHLLRTGVEDDAAINKPVAETLWRHFSTDKLQTSVVLHYTNKLKVLKFSELFSLATRQPESDSPEEDSIIATQTDDAWSPFEKRACCTCDCNRERTTDNYSDCGPRGNTHSMANEDSHMARSTRQNQMDVNEVDRQHSATVDPQQMYVCLLCHALLTSDSQISTLPCDHVFHCTCLVSWIEGSNHSCPSCNWPIFQNKK